MLKHQLIHPKINEVLGRAGHHAKILIADGNYPASTKKGPNAEVISMNLSRQVARGKIGIPAGGKWRNHQHRFAVHFKVVTCETMPIGCLTGKRLCRGDFPCERQLREDSAAHHGSKPPKQ